MTHEDPPGLHGHSTSSFSMRSDSERYEEVGMQGKYVPSPYLTRALDRRQLIETLSSKYPLLATGEEEEWMEQLKASPDKVKMVVGMKEVPLEDVYKKGLILPEDADMEAVEEFDETMRDLKELDRNGVFRDMEREYRESPDTFFEVLESHEESDTGNGNVDRENGRYPHFLRDIQDGIPVGSDGRISKKQAVGGAGLLTAAAFMGMMDDDDTFQEKIGTFAGKMYMKTMLEYKDEVTLDGDVIFEMTDSEGGDISTYLRAEDDWDYPVENPPMVLTQLQEDDGDKKWVLYHGDKFEPRMEQLDEQINPGKTSVTVDASKMSERDFPDVWDVNKMDHQDMPIYSASDWPEIYQTGGSEEGAVDSSGERPDNSFWNWLVKPGGDEGSWEDVQRPVFFEGEGGSSANNSDDPGSSDTVQDGEGRASDGNNTESGRDNTSPQNNGTEERTNRTHTERDGNGTRSPDTEEKEEDQRRLRTNKTTWRQPWNRTWEDQYPGASMNLTVEVSYDQYEKCDNNRSAYGFEEKDSDNTYVLINPFLKDGSGWLRDQQKRADKEIDHGDTVEIETLKETKEKAGKEFHFVTEVKSIDKSDDESVGPHTDKYTCEMVEENFDNY